MELSGNAVVCDTNSNNDNAQSSCSIPENNDSDNVGVGNTNSDNVHAQSSSNGVHGITYDTQATINVPSRFGDDNEPNRTCSKCDASLLSDGESVCHLQNAVIISEENGISVERPWRIRRIEWLLEVTYSFDPLASVIMFSAFSKC